MTDTNQASELFELCKKVYEATGWENDGYVKYLNKAPNYECRYHNAPLYTSDYLLEKLPEWTTVTKVGNDTGKYNASYELGYTTSLGDTYLQGTSDTPLLALLKLTIALSEAGELNNE